MGYLLSFQKKKNSYHTDNTYQNNLNFSFQTQLPISEVLHFNSTVCLVNQYYVIRDMHHELIKNVSLIRCRDKLTKTNVFDNSQLIRIGKVRPSPLACTYSRWGFYFIINKRPLDTLSSGINLIFSKILK